MNAIRRQEEYRYSHGEQEPLHRGDVLSAWFVGALLAAGLVLAM